MVLIIFARTYFILGVVIIIMLPLLGNTFSIFPQKTHVRIQNALEGNKDLMVHCKSRDNDIGEQYLKPHQCFEFHFKTNVWGSTLFFCGFNWQGGRHWYDIYIHERDFTVCSKLCAWQVKQNGPCLYDHKTNSYTHCRVWNDQIFRR
ncbi:hypothetical protein HN51_067192 [Arachis hypogaea]